MAGQRRRETTFKTNFAMTKNKLIPGKLYRIKLAYYKNHPTSKYLLYLKDEETIVEIPAQQLLLFLHETNSKRRLYDGQRYKCYWFLYDNQIVGWLNNDAPLSFEQVTK